MHEKNLLERVQKYSAPLRRPEIKVLFMSGYPADIIKDRGQMKGEYSYISKPISPNALLRSIRDVLDEASTGRSGALAGE